MDAAVVKNVSAKPASVAVLETAGVEWQVVTVITNVMGFSNSDSNVSRRVELVPPPAEVSVPKVSWLLVLAIFAIGYAGIGMLLLCLANLF